MNVLRVVSTMNPRAGGVVEAINQACNSYNNDSQKMDVLCFDNPSVSWVGNLNGYNVFTVGQGISSYFYNRNYLYWLKENASNYNLVIFDGLWQYLSCGYSLLKQMNVPYCVFPHGMLDPYFNKNKLKYLKKLPFWFFVEREMIANAKATIFTCEEEKILAEKSFPTYKSNPMVATLGVKGATNELALCSQEFFKSFPNLKHKKFVLFMSRINKKKGLEILIEAIYRTKDVLVDLFFAIAGPDSDNLQHEIEAKIRQLGIENKFFWLGMLSGDIKWGAYNASDCFILPSHQENFGIVVAEALSTGTPVLITNKVNIWREVQSNEAGFISNDDIDGISDLLCRWVELEDKQKSRMSVNAEQCYKRNFTTANAHDSLTKVIDFAVKSI